ncbi:fluoride efflux transporter CrcB [Flavobacterium sp. MAH-1]|uniref:Fluoride-specific ion channel FluC n=1 Tax=Flavobacterium agri TaxID=2743471 RepID=A0A7Y8Y4N8_9FLAO|nr:fluoride efflux transporter CrcB [Flavobacterium agri]NUY82437.1 fluoride efflux transporter CrcB [Flavobacterium agri]NYA72461.1 fluoride efflux transporter CrcB [Flavobacterium agri]
MVRNMLLVALGGAIGSVLRYLTAIFVNRYFQSVFPWATLVTNVIGCFIIGLFLGQLQKNGLVDSGYKWFLVTGFCGGYTTFSTFGHENIALMQTGNGALAFVYIAASVIVGLAAVWLGLFISQ